MRGCGRVGRGHRCGETRVRIALFGTRQPASHDLVLTHFSPGTGRKNLAHGVSRGNRKPSSPKPRNGATDSRGVHLPDARSVAIASIPEIPFVVFYPVLFQELDELFLEGHSPVMFFLVLDVRFYFGQ